MATGPLTFGAQQSSHTIFKGVLYNLTISHTFIFMFSFYNCDACTDLYLPFFINCTYCFAAHFEVSGLVFNC